MMANSGVSIRQMMEQMRHKEERLTTTVYTDLHLIDKHAAVGSLPRITGSHEGCDRRPSDTHAAIGSTIQDIDYLAL